MPTRILPPTPIHLAEAAAYLTGGDVVAMPTETVYGLAASLWREDGLARIFACKARPHFDPLIVHLSSEMAADQNFLHRLVAFRDLAQQQLFERLRATFWPGPLTLVLPKAAGVPDLATSGLPTLAVRVPRHPVAQALLQQVGVPLAAPSANRFGRISPTCAGDVLAELDGRIPLILEGGPCHIGLESTVLGWNEAEQPILLRPGAISSHALTEVLGQPVLQDAPHPAEILAPGMLKNHYAPRKPLYLLPADWRPEQVLPTPQPGTPALLLPYGNAPALSAQIGVEVQTLSATPNPEQAARHLFACLRSLDQSDADYLLTQLPAETSALEYAISNRLRKAAGC
jgi:L-threonylcarbamoyladenylate synthase